MTAADGCDLDELVTIRAHVMRGFFRSGASRALNARRSALVRLRAQLKRNEDRILAALQSDLGKAPFEGYATELGIVYDEISFCLKHMEKWARPRRVPTPLVHHPASSKVIPSPMGVVLVMSPWNYPLQLALVPLVDAIAAGNCVAIKPSRTSPATGAVIADIVSEAFDPGHACVFEGFDGMNERLLEEKWDLIFFTGSPAVGRTVMTAAAKHLTPVVLELGGKSPCIVDASARIPLAASRIAWGKGINSGQTCVAPDYLLVHESVVDQLVGELEKSFSRYYGSNALACGEWPRMVNERHFDRVCGLIDERGPACAIAFGGRRDRSTLKIEPTCMTGVSLSDPVMGEEIFGPVLPVLTYRTLDEAFDVVRSFEKPLAAYVFAEDESVCGRVLDELEFGGATINDVVIHLANNHMGFGGVGNSGMGSYHGKAGFDCFTHYKSTLKRATWMDVPVRNPPFGNKIKLVRMLMR